MRYWKPLQYMVSVVFFLSSCEETAGLLPFIDKPESSKPEVNAPDGCSRPYAEDSIWNIPVDWQIAQIHPDSEAMIDAFFESYGWIGANTASYAPNIYFVNEQTPLSQVKLREYSFRNVINDQQISYGEPGGIVLLPLPDNAKPSPGTDGQLAVINLDTREEWGMNEGEKVADGLWQAGGVYRYHIDSSGVPPKGFGQRGAGIGQVAGIVRPCEVDRGIIGHAVTLAYDSPCAPEVCKANGWPEVIPPFTKTDGAGQEKYDIPEGARLVIDPDIPLEEVYEACSGVSGCIAWVLNMQYFGGFIVDKSDHPKTYAEGNATANWDSDVWFESMLKNIPTDWFRVIDWNYPSTSTD